ncbi:MAG TPA: sterol desaturase family protein [Methylomirabilota bacterium]|nr:sterol desaturase family protein [Methylomirabilota bacterium]
MNGLERVFVIFAIVQTTFVVLDVATLARAARGGTLPALRDVGAASAAFLAVVWLAYFVIQAGLMALVPGVDEVVAWLAGPPGAPASSAWPLVPLLAATWIVAGFFDYALHRWLLHTRGGWFLHENHHLPTVVANGVPGISVRPFVAVTTFLTYLGTAAVMLGVMAATDTAALVPRYLASVPVLVLGFTLVGSASHSAFLRQFPGAHALLRPLLVTTPQEHVLHHDPRLAGNYGNFTSLWDRVFGTYLSPRTHGGRALVLGLPYDQDFLGTLTGGYLKLSEGVRDRYRLDAFCHLSRRPGAASEEGAR